MARLVRAVPALTLVVVAALLSACSESHEPAPFSASELSGTPAPVGTPTPSPVATTPPVPLTSSGRPTTSKAARPTPDPTGEVIVTNPAFPAGRDEMTALVAVRDYSSQLLAGLDSGSSAQLRRLSASTCEQCRRDADLVDQRVKLGRHFENLDGTKGWRQLIVGSRGRLEGDYVSRAQVIEAPNRFLERDGRVIKVNAKPVVYNSVYVVRVGPGGVASILSITEAPSS